MRRRRQSVLFFALLLSLLTASCSSAKVSLQTQLHEPLLLATRLIAEAKWRPIFDRAVQNLPTAASSGERWKPANPAWQKVHLIFDSRLERTLEQLDKLGGMANDIQRSLERHLSKKETGDLAKRLSKSADNNLLWAYVEDAFVLHVLSSSPNEPKSSDLTFASRYESLRSQFRTRAKHVVAQSNSLQQQKINVFADAYAQKMLGAMGEILSESDRQMTTAMNLILFDEADTIKAEADAVLANVK
jgi:hypothetical protein